MKKLIMLLIVISLICGCSKKEPEKIQDVIVEKSYIKQLTNGTYNSAFPQVGNQNGYYYLENNSESINILYLDYESKTETYLCNQIGCQHVDDTCTSYMQNTGILFLNNDKLYFLQDRIIDKSNQMLYQMDMTGDNKKVLYEFENNQTYDGEKIYGDTENIYITFNHSQIMKYNLKNNTMQAVYDLQDGEVLVGSSKGILYIQSNKEYDNQIQTGATEYFIKELDVIEKTVVNVFEFPKLEKTSKEVAKRIVNIPVKTYSYMFNDGLMYFVNSNDKTLKITDIANKTEKSITLDKINFSDKTISIEEISSKILILKLDMPVQRYIIELETGKVIESVLLTQGSKGSSEKRLLDPVQINNDFVIFYNGSTPIKIYQKMPNGDVNIIDSSKSSFNFISINDYINNIENYVNAESSADKN